ncbi:hypothetical protein D3C78_1405240 [compost metagenome]
MFVMATSRCQAPQNGNTQQQARYVVAIRKCERHEVAHHCRQKNQDCHKPQHYAGNSLDFLGSSIYQLEKLHKATLPARNWRKTGLPTQEASSDFLVIFTRTQRNDFSSWQSDHSRPYRRHNPAC